MMKVNFSITYKTGKQTELKNPYFLHGLASQYICIEVEIDIKFRKIKWSSGLTLSPANVNL